MCQHRAVEGVRQVRAVRNGAPGCLAAETGRESACPFPAFRVPRRLLRHSHHKHWRRASPRRPLWHPLRIHYAMECKNCELRQRHFYCASCLKTQFVSLSVSTTMFSKLTATPPPRCSLRDFRLKTQHVAADRDEHVARAARALKPVEEQRRRRADLAVSQAHVQDLRTALAARREENEKGASEYLYNGELNRRKVVCSCNEGGICGRAARAAD